MKAKVSYKYKQGIQFYQIVCTICFITNISQMPVFIDNFSTRNIVIPLWILFGVFCVLKEFNFYMRESKSLFLIAYLFLLYYILGNIFIGKYRESALPYVIFLAIFILGIGLLAGRFLRKEDIEKMCTAMILSGIIVGIDVFRKYIYGSSLIGRVYAYDSKNSVSQILLTTWILILFFKLTYGKLVKKIFYYVSFALLTVTLIGLKSRATLIMIPIIVAWIVIHGRLDKKVRNIVLIMLGLIIIYLVYNSDFFDTLINEVLLGGRSIGNLNDISSGRMNEWTSFWSDFQGGILFGHGRMKRESLILTSLLEFGIVGGGLILLLATWPLYWAMRYYKKDSKYYLIFSSIAIAYLVNGIFEQLAPFGPGVKCFFLWFFMGVLIQNKNLNDEELEAARSE